MTSDNLDDISYFRYARPQMIDKAIHTLEGIIRGIGIDGNISGKELNEVLHWCNEHGRLKQRQHRQYTHKRHST